MSDNFHLTLRKKQLSGKSILLVLLIGFLFYTLNGCQFAGFGSKSRFTPEPGSNKNPCLVLALPDSGPYAPVAKKIRQGAGIAVEELKAQGTSTRLENINTEAPDWLAKLEALPQICAIVGGPIQEKAYLQAKKSGLLDKRVFFSFVPTLQKGEEGIIAWRFFPSPQDQIDALTSFVTDKINIRTYGAFYPNDAYGQHMSNLLESTLSQKHIKLNKASYNPKEPATWSASLSRLIKPVKTNGQPVPQTDFEALFLPDSWKNMDMLTTSLLFNGEDRLVLMGTNLWEAGLGGNPVPKAAKYELAVFPAAWNKNNSPKKLQSANNDFWVALGFDFVNFGAHMGLMGRPMAADVIEVAQKSSGKIRAMAPIAWDNAGIAKQRLYLFQVGSNGMKPVDVEHFKRTRNQILERAALRFQSINSSSSDEMGESPAREAGVITPMTGQNQSVTQPSASPKLSPPPQTGGMNEAPLSTVPQSSYKLRLPEKK